MPDKSNSNWVNHNYFDTQGNECVYIKENASYNIVEHNECHGQLDAKSGGMSVRGSHNILRFNLISGNKGAGIRLGGDTPANGIYNKVYGNTLRNNEYTGLKIMVLPQALLCGNSIEYTKEYKSSRGADIRPVRGTYAQGIDPTAACPGSL